MTKSTVALLSALSTLTVSLTAFGQDLLQCVNPDVVKGVLYFGRPDSQVSITAAVPDALAGYEAPSEFELLGSAVRGNGASTTVAYGTSLDREAAYAALLASFEAEGWALDESMLPVSPIFVLDSRPVSGIICRDGERRSLTTEVVNDRIYAKIALSDQPATRGCNAEDPIRDSIGRRMMSLLTEQAPTLELPEGTTAADGSGSINTGGGGSGDTYATDARIRITLAAPSFMQDLAAQMSAQGWSAEARWSGTLSNGGRWTRTGDNGIMFWTTLELVDVGDGVYDLSFRTMMPPL